MVRSLKMLGGVVMFATVLFLAGCASQPQAVHTDASSSINVDGVQAGAFDTGKMWTFDFPPMEYFSKTYSFNPTKEWFEKARLSALRLQGCTGAFVSEDGLVMTNHHCVRGSLDRINKEGEKLATDGFYAVTLGDERKIPNAYIDQLIVIEDVTAEIQSAFAAGTTEAEKVSKRMAKITEIQQRYWAKAKETSKDSMVFSVVTFYNGGRYSLYGYKRYTDIRMVYAPDEQVAFYGGDPDNFTYPRYDFDCSFYRVYEGDKPVKTSNFFRFSKEGAKEGEAVFVIGNPGSTYRLLTVAQLQAMRDYSYPANVALLGNMMNTYQTYVEKHPEQKLKYQTMIFGIANSLKNIGGQLKGLKDPMVMAKKMDFEKKFRNAVLEDAQLKAKYGDVWTEIAGYQSEMNALTSSLMGYGSGGRRGGGSTYWSVASTLVDYAKAMKGPAEKIPPQFQNLDAMKARFYPGDANKELDEMMLAMQLTNTQKAFAGKNAAFNKLMAGRSVEQTAADLAANSVVSSKEKALELLSAGPDKILASTDPLVSYFAGVADEATALRTRAQELGQKQAAKFQLLGNAMYDVYGTKIPPDATFTLRIADGVVKGYPYNGTEAPAFTTFYGMYDRHFSFPGRHEWALPEKWLNPPADFNMSTPMNIVATNDIVGGNSGSSMINRNHEIVGLIFDGNIESLPGSIIYDDTANRSVSVHSSGILEGLEKIYKAERIAKELREGKIQ